MDDETLRRLALIERRLQALEEHFPTPLPQLPPPLPRSDPEPESVPVLPRSPNKRLPAWITATLTEAEHDAHAESLQSGYDGGPPDIVPVAASQELPFAIAAADDADGAAIGPEPASSSPIAPSPMTDYGRRPPPAPPVPAALNLEQTLGLKWAGWVGAIVLVIGAALGVKYAYDQGWLGGMPDAVRCAMIAVAGLGLIGGGEFVFRRINRLAATGLYGAGVAVLYLAAYAGQAWYGLFAPPLAIGLMAGAALIGLAIAARADLVSIAALAVIGATACPFWFGESTSSPNGLRVYFIAIQILAIGLCAWRAEPKWWTLRGLALAATTIGQLVTIWPYMARVDLVGMLIVGASALLYQCELIYTTGRRTGDRLTDSDGYLFSVGHANQRVPGLVFSLLVTAALTLEWMAYLDGQSRSLHGQVVLVLSAAAFIFGRLQLWPRVAALARGFDVQAVLLLTLAAAVWFDGPARLFAWMLLAAGLAVLGIFSRDRLAVGGAAAVWTLTVFVALLSFSDSHAARHVWLQIGGQPIVAAVGVGAALALVGHLTAFALNRLESKMPTLDAPRVTVGLFFDFAAVAVLMAMLVENTSAAVTTRGGLVYAVLLWAVSFGPALSMLGVVSGALLALVAMKWAAFDVLSQRLTHHWTPTGRPLVNAQTATGAVIAGLFALVGWTNRRRLERSPAVSAASVDRLWAIGCTLAMISFVFAASFEADRAIALGRDAGGWTAWPDLSALQLILTMLWSAGVALWLLALRWTIATAAMRVDVQQSARIVAYLLAAKLLFVDILGLAMTGVVPSPPLVFNLRMLAMLVVIGLLTFTRAPRGDTGDTTNRDRDPAFGLTIMLLLLVTGSAEIDRYAVQQSLSPTWIVRQVGWSIYWAGLAVATLLVGFALRRRPLRLAALGLLAITLVKVTIIDLAGAGTGWRILSFLGLGVLLLLTSVLYGQFEMRMREPEPPPLQ